MGEISDIVCGTINAFEIQSSGDTEYILRCMAQQILESLGRYIMYGDSAVTIDNPKTVHVGNGLGAASGTPNETPT